VTTPTANLDLFVSVAEQNKLGLKGRSCKEMMPERDMTQNMCWPMVKMFLNCNNRQDEVGNIAVSWLQDECLDTSRTFSQMLL